MSDGDGERTRLTTGREPSFSATGVRGTLPSESGRGFPVLAGGNRLRATLGLLVPLRPSNARARDEAIRAHARATQGLPFPRPGRPSSREPLRRAP